MVTACTQSPAAWSPILRRILPNGLPRRSWGFHLMPRGRVPRNLLILAAPLDWGGLPCPARIDRLSFIVSLAPFFLLERQVDLPSDRSQVCHLPAKARS